jgi:hypothetical protein
VIYRLAVMYRLAVIHRFALTPLALILPRE